MRVIAGTAGGRRLVVPPHARPTTDRVKESVFSALGDVDGAAVLDLYAGSGALAIEALSRGAARALLVDRDRAAVDACRRNLDAARVSDRGRVQSSSAATVLRAGPPDEAPFDLVLVDPPYDATVEDVCRIVEELAEPGWLAPEARVVVERSTRVGAVLAPNGWEIAWQREYGDTLVAVLRQQD